MGKAARLVDHNCATDTVELLHLLHEFNLTLNHIHHIYQHQYNKLNAMNSSLVKSKVMLAPSLPLGRLVFNPASPKLPSKTGNWSISQISAKKQLSVPNKYMYVQGK